MPTPSGTQRQARRTDPDRRDRIIDTALDVIAEGGVAGTSHRKVAAAAGVPLGSMTYHFSGMSELLFEAFSRFSHTVSEQFETRLAAAADFEQAVDAVVALITEDIFTAQRDLVLTHELYTLAAREPAFRTITDDWMARSRHALERHFDPGTARMLDAFIEGITIHRALGTERSADHDLIRATVRRLAEPPGPSGPS